QRTEQVRARKTASGGAHLGRPPADARSKIDIGPTPLTSKQGLKEEKGAAGEDRQERHARRHRRMVERGGEGAPDRPQRLGPTGERRETFAQTREEVGRQANAAGGRGPGQQQPEERGEPGDGHARRRHAETDGSASPTKRPDP